MEIWKDIEGYECLYQISSEGRVRSLDRVGDRGWNYKGEEHHRNKPVIQYDKKNNFIGEYFSIREASKENSVREQGISACCRGKLKTCGGYIWKYKRIAI